MRPLSVLLALLSLSTACYDFKGDLGRVGFSSNLRLSSGAWTPAHRIASGATAAFAPSEDLANPDAKLDDLVASVSGHTLTTWVDEGTTFVSSDRGRGVVAWHGRLSDRFKVDFEDPARAALPDPLAVMLKVEDAPGERLALITGVPWTGTLRLADRRGRELGWNPDQVELQATGGVSAWVEEGSMMVTADGDGEIAIAWMGQPVATVPVRAADAGEVVEIEVFTKVMPEEDGTETTAALAVPRLADGTPVWGVDVDWQWEGATQTAKWMDRGDAIWVGSMPGSPVQLDARLR